MSKKKPLRCPFHEAIGGFGIDPCAPSPESCEAAPGTENGCSLMLEARLLQDRLDAIAALVEQARDGVLSGSDQASPGMPLSAALEAAGVLARSITEDEYLKGKDTWTRPGDDRLLWIVLRPERVNGARSPYEKKPAPPSLRAVPAADRAS